MNKGLSHNRLANIDCVKNKDIKSYSQRYSNLGGRKMTKVNIYVTLRESVVDSQGIATEDALQKLGYKEVKNVRIGRLIELELDGTTVDIEKRVDEMCKELLINRVIEDYRFDIEEA